jgi:hypothetical protein
VFVRGLKCKARPLRAPKVIEAAAEPRDDFRPPKSHDGNQDLEEESELDNMSDYSVEDLDGHPVSAHP